MTAPPAGTWREWAGGAGAVALAALVAYLPALGAGFVFDDHGLVEQSAQLEGPLWRIWFAPSAKDYWPLTWTTFWVERRLWGTAPFGYHLLNVTLHAGTAVLLWRVLRALEVKGALLAGLLFAVHPVAVESVAWISERKNTLSGALFAGAALAFVAHLRRGRTRSYLAALGLFVLGVLAKGSVVVLPVVLVGIALARGRRLLPALRTLAPFFAVAAAGAAVTLWFQWQVAAPRFMLPPRGLWERVGGAGWAWLSYLQTGFVPAGLAFFHEPWPVAPTSPLYFAPLGALALGIAALFHLRRKGATPVLLAVGYHLVLVAPVLGLLDMVYLSFAPVSNHLQYLALMGPVALVAAAFTWVLERAQGPNARRALYLAAALVVGALGAHTFRRARAFEDDVTLFRAAVRDAPGSLVAWWQLSDALHAQGRRAEALQATAAAVEAVREPASRLHARALLHLARAELPQAVDAVLEAERVRPAPGFVRDVAMQLVLGGATDEAMRLILPARARYPGYVDFHYWQGAALARQKKVHEARAVLQQAAALAPRDEQIRTALQVVEAAIGPGR